MAALLILIAGIFVIAAFNGTPPAEASPSASAGLPQVSATPAAEDGSVVGSTDGIVVMGILVTLIVITPVLLRRKKKSGTSPDVSR